MNLIINGQAVHTTNRTLSYATIALLVDEPSPSIRYTRLDGRTGIVTAGSTIDLTDGMVITTIQTEDT